MRVLVLYDETSENYQGENLTDKILHAIHDAGHKAKAIRIQGGEFDPCIGCFGCWVKTPGMCLLTRDDANLINNDMVNSDAFLILTPIVYGGYSADIKSYLDRIIPVVSPFFAVIHGESHHQARYEQYPNFIGVGYGTGVTDKEAETFKTLIHRNSINFHSPNALALTIRDSSQIEATLLELTRFLKEVLI